MATQEQSEAEPAEKPRPKRRKRDHALRSLGAGSFLLTASLVLVCLAGLYLASGRPIHAPDWLRDRIEARVAAGIAPADLSVGDMQLVVVDGWQPRLRLNDVRLISPLNETIVAFSQMDVSVALEALLRGELRPSHVALAGVFASVQKDADGQFRLSGGVDLESPAQEAPNLAGLIKAFDGVLLQKEMLWLETAEIQALTVRYSDAGLGRFWTLDGGQLRLNRDGNDLRLNADLAILGGDAGIATLTANYASTLGSAAAEFGVQVDGVDAGDVAVQSPAFGWLSSLRAPISGSMRSGLDEAGVLQPLIATLSIGEGVLQPTEATRPIPFQSARTYFSYDPKANSLQFDELFVDSKWVSGSASGTAWMDMDSETGRLARLVSQLEVSNLAINPFAIYPEPRQINTASADLRLTLAPFRIELGQAVLDLGGNLLHASGDLRAETEGWRFAIDGQVASTEPAQIIDWWPERFATGSRRWIRENVLKARLTQLDLALRGNPGRPIESLLSFDYTGADVRFLKTMPPVTDGQGQVTMAENRLVVSVDAGQIEAPEGGVLDVAGSTFIIENTRIKKGAPAVVALRSDSSIRAALSLLDQPPLRVMERAGRDANLAEGRALLEGSIRLPLKKGVKPDEIDYAVSGQLEDVQSRALLANRSLSAQSLVLEANPGEILIGGPGTIDGLAFEAAWQRKLSSDAPAELNGSIALSDAALRSFGVTLPPGTLRGSARGDLRVSLPKGGAPRFTLTSNLRGATLRVDAIGWSKAGATAGELTVAGTLGKTPDISRLDITAPGLRAAGRVSLKAGGALDEIRFSRLRVGNWLDAPVTLIGRGKGAVPAVRTTGGRIDLRRATFGGDGGGGTGQSGPMTLSLDSLQVSDNIRLTSFAGQFSGGRGLNGSFTARVNGGPQVSGRVVPQNGRSAVQITSGDAGAVMAAAGLLKQARGGQMALTLLPVDGAEGVFDGTLKVNNTRVKNAPAMADLLSAVSVVGLLEQLSGDGISFNTVDAAFRMTPSQIVLSRASAVGPSMGLSMDGRYGLTNQQMDMQGVISPVYFLNAIGRIFARRGEGLIGFNYRLRGTASDPRVQVNPFSALTPGLFREIFRAPPPDLPAAEAPRTQIPEELANEAQQSTTTKKRNFIEERQRLQDER